MVETHLPFMTPEESTFRLIGSYLLGQYLRAKAGQEADFALARLPAFFGELEQVDEDASVNAVVILSTLGSMARFSLADGDVDRLARLFSSHLDAAGDQTPANETPSNTSVGVREAE
jgi:hypothetical protein